MKRLQIPLLGEVRAGIDELFSHLLDQYINRHILEEKTEKIVSNWKGANIIEKEAIIAFSDSDRIEELDEILAEGILFTREIYDTVSKMNMPGIFKLAKSAGICNPSFWAKIPDAGPRGETFYIFNSNMNMHNFTSDVSETDSFINIGIFDGDTKVYIGKQLEKIIAEIRNKA